MPTTQQSPLPCWIIYLALLPVCLAPYSSRLIAAIWLIALIGALVLRKRAHRNNGASMTAAHASWQVNTLWIELALFVLLCVLLVFFFYQIGSDQTVRSQLESITEQMTSGAIDPKSGLLALWDMPNIRHMVIAAIIPSILLMLWPTWRTLRGMTALARKKSPADLRFSISILLLFVAALAVCVPFWLL